MRRLPEPPGNGSTASWTTVKERLAAVYERHAPEAAPDREYYGLEGLPWSAEPFYKSRSSGTRTSARCCPPSPSPAPPTGPGPSDELSKQWIAVFRPSSGAGVFLVRLRDSGTFTRSADVKVDIYRTARANAGPTEFRSDRSRRSRDCARGIRVNAKDAAYTSRKDPDIPDPVGGGPEEHRPRWSWLAS